ncbi:MAG: tetratricopeptide repeat protein [Salinibacter sp.]
MTTRESTLSALVLGILGLLTLTGCLAGNPNMGAAKSAMDRKNYERALAHVKRALAQDSTNAKAYMMKARILRQMADTTTPAEKYEELHRRAHEAEEKAIKFDPSVYEKIRNQRELAYIQEFQQGVEAFDKARRTESGDQFRRAAAYFGAAGTIQPDSTDPILNEAFARLRAARFAEGEAAAEQMSEVIPILERYIEKEEEPTKNAYTILAQLYRQDDQLEKVIDLAEAAIEDLSSRPLHFRIQGTKGVKYAGTIEVGRASRSVEGTVPDRIQLSTRRGRIAGSFTKDESGKRQTQSRLRVSLYAKGTEVASGQTTSSSDSVKVSANLSDVTPLAELQNYRLNALNRAGETKRAMQAYRERTREAPNDAIYRYNYGSLLLKAGRYDEAIEQLKKAVELDSKDPKKQYNLGVAYLNNGLALRDSLAALRDALSQKDRTPTEEERRRVKKLDQQRLELFKKAIPPLERARQLSARNGTYHQKACSALFQAYVQTEQTEKAQQVKKCAAQTDASLGVDSAEKSGPETEQSGVNPNQLSETDASTGEKPRRFRLSCRTEETGPLVRCEPGSSLRRTVSSRTPSQFRLGWGPWSLGDRATPHSGRPQ